MHAENCRGCHVGPRVSGSRQHHLAAGLIGGFGTLDPRSQSHRDAHVVALIVSSGRIEPRRAHSLGWERNLYRLQAPPPGIHQDVIDHLWSPTEAALPDLISRLDTRQLKQPEDTETLRDYLAAAVVRHPSFEDQAAAIYAAQGKPAPTGDDLQLVRLGALRGAGIHVLNWRWRVLHSPPDCQRFVLNDRGWSVIQEVGRSDIGLFVPMGPRVALYGYPDAPDLPPRVTPFTEHRDLAMTWVEWFNTATAGVIVPDSYIKEVIGHPGDAGLLERLRDGAEVFPSWTGPYRFPRANVSTLPE